MKFTNNEHQIKVYPRNFLWSASSGYSLVLFTDSEPIIGIGDDTTEIHHIVFHLFNFKEIFGMSTTTEKINTDIGTNIYPIYHVSLKTDNWTVELRSLVESNDNFKKLKNEGGYGLTHICYLKKIDDNIFSGREAKEILDDLGLFFSFAI